MRMRHQTNWLDRRRFLAGSTAALAGGTSVARAQTAPKESPRLSARIAEFATGFDLAKAPPLAIERARTAFVDTIGVTLAGSTAAFGRIAHYEAWALAGSIVLGLGVHALTQRFGKRLI